MVLAHGIGGRGDLPLPVWLFAYGAGAAVLVSFVALAWFWTAARLEDELEGRPLPGWIQAAAPLAAAVLRIFGVAALGLILWSAWAGSTDPDRNLAPTTLYVVFWVGLQMASALIGDLWRVVSPYDTAALIVERLRGTRPDREAPAWGHWPAAVVILAFTWMELVHPTPASPRLLAGALTAYTAYALAGALLWGRSWLRTGEGFAAWFGLLARMAPFVRGEDGRLRVRPPLAGLVGVVPLAGTVALVMVGLGSTSYDGLSRTQFWKDVLGNRAGWDAVPLASLGLMWMVLLVGIAFTVSMRVAAGIVGREADELTAWFVHSLVPIALAYAIAHYFSLLAFQGQAAYALVSDPLGRGWDLFGTADRAINYTWISTAAIAWVQAGAIVAGHVSGVLMAHDRAVARFDESVASRSQYPLLAAMVLYTVGGLALLLGA